MYFCKKKFFLFSLLTIFYFKTVSAVEIEVNTTINADVREQITLTVNNLTLINNATIEETETDGSIKPAINLSGITVINNAGAVIKQGANLTSVIDAERNTNFTLINSGTISADHTIAAGKGAHSVGPITVNATVTVNGNWVVS